LDTKKNDHWGVIIFKVILKKNRGEENFQNRGQDTKHPFSFSFESIGRNPFSTSGCFLLINVQFVLMNVENYLMSHF